MNQNEMAIEKMKLFVSGQMTSEEFWEEFKSNKLIKELLIEDEKNKNRHPDWWCSAKKLEQKIRNISSYHDSDMLHESVSSYFKNTEVFINNFYSDRYRFLIRIQPSWLDITHSNEKFLIDLVASAPKELNETQKTKWCQDKVKCLFKYDKKPPQWVQNAEWPIVNGKPLVFKNQSKERSDSELVKFFFYDEETGAETVIEQFY